MITWPTSISCATPAHLDNQFVQELIDYLAYMTDKIHQERAEVQGCLV